MPTYSASNSLTIRVALDTHHGTLARLTAAIADAEGNVGAIDIVRVQDAKLIRDLTIYTFDQAHADRVVAAMNAVDGVEVQHVSDRTFLIHLGGKIEIKSKTALNTRDDLSMAYTPGVARVCSAIHKDPSKAYNLTIKRNTVAVVSDGSAVLGLGNIGPEAAMPVMEGKAQLFKSFADVDAWPICLATQDPEAIIEAVAAIAPGFGGINLEDIAAPNCFRIEEELKKRLDIPVFHDDQHGTAVVLIAGLINALRFVDKKPENIRVVMVGVGAAGTACMLMLRDLGVTNIIGCDRRGTLYTGRDGMNDAKEKFAAVTNPDKIDTSLKKPLLVPMYLSDFLDQISSAPPMCKRWPKTRLSLRCPIPIRKSARKKPGHTSPLWRLAAVTIQTKSITCCASPDFSVGAWTAKPTTSPIK